MTIKCNDCDAVVLATAASCSRCGALIAGQTSEPSRPVRKRLGLKFTIVVIGTAGAIIAGGGKPGRPAAAQAAPMHGVQQIDIDGLGGPQLARLEAKFASSAKH